MSMKIMRFRLFNIFLSVCLLYSVFSSAIGTVNSAAAERTQPSQLVKLKGDSNGGGNNQGSNQGGNQGGNNGKVIIASVSAVNGTINVAFDKKPSSAPKIKHFVVQEAINGGTARTVTPTDIAWDPESHTAALTVPIVSATGIDQSVVYRVSYKGATAVEAAAFTVPGEAMDSNLIVMNGQPNAVIIDSSPITITDKSPRNWNKWANIPGAVELTADVALAGYVSLSISDMGRGGVIQTVRVYPGSISGQIYYYSPSGGSSAGTISINMNLLDEEKNVIAWGPIHSEVMPLSDATDGWKLITLEGNIPETWWDGSPVYYAAIAIDVDGGYGAQVYVDDFVIQQADGNNLLINPGFEDIPLKMGRQLADYVKKSTGADLPILASEPSDYNGVKIFVGNGRAEDETRHRSLLQGMNDQGFLIDSQPNAITIVGKTNRATEYGVLDFLERYVGVRWLMPGPDGEDVPQLDALSVPISLERDQPITISRHFFGTDGPTSFSEWAMNNRMYDNIQFHHNMTRLFDPSVFSDHPEYYAGNVVPTRGSYSWHPCFNDETAEAASARIIDFFDNNPDASSYSLGLNDSANYCGNPPTKINSIGKRNQSDKYYPWVNKIVEGVLEKYPDKYFGLLAYAETYDPPMNEDGTPYKLNSHVIPYITEDRMSWIDESREDKAKQLMEEWHKSATNLGWYDYMYGTPYNLPRLYSHQMAANYKYAEEQGVIGHVAELFPNFGEGPKPWVSAKLQWNPDQDVDELLNNWYVSAVGEDAAPYLKEYFDNWEHFWTTKIFESAWYKTWKINGLFNYLDMSNSSYLEEVTKEDIGESRRLLELVVANAETNKQKARAQLLLKAFEFYEASALSYTRSNVKDPANAQEANEMMDDIILSFSMAKKRLELAAEFANHPTLFLPLSPTKLDGIQTPMIEALLSYTEMHPEEAELRERLRQFMVQVPELRTNSAFATKTTASKEQILQSLDFSSGPWLKAEPITDFLVMNTGEEAPAKTSVRLLWDNENLYVGYENFDQDLSKMVTSEDTLDNWWSSGGDDSVETYVTANPNGTYSGYFTNAKAVKFVFTKDVTSGLAPGTDSKWQASAKVDDDHGDRWNVIQVIPFSSIGVNPILTRELKAFFFRNYHGQTTFLGWGGGAPWHPEHFNTVYLVESNNLLENSSFESGSSETDFAPWMHWINGAGGEHIYNKRTNDHARTGDYSFVGEGLKDGAGPYQMNISITPGKYKAVLYCYSETDQTTEGTFQFYHNITNTNGENANTQGDPQFIIKSNEISVSMNRGKWVRKEFNFEIKPDYSGYPPKWITFGIAMWNFNPGEKVYIDDVSLYKME